MSQAPEASMDFRSMARDVAVRFLYQCESTRISYYAANHFKGFVSNIGISGPVAVQADQLAKGTLDRLSELDVMIQEASPNWKVSRMAMTDRCVLRMALNELLEGQTPPKVILNEAIELAKRYGTEHSGSFVNGVLDALMKRVKSAAS